MRYYLIFWFVLLAQFNIFGSDYDYCNTDCESEDEWSFKIAPYLWMAGLRGDVATLPPLPPVSVDVTFSEILRHMDGSLMLAGEVQKGRVSLAADIMYVSLSGTAHFPDGRFSSAHLKTKYWVGTASLGYDFIRTDCYFVAALVGARIWSVTTDLSLGAGLLPALSFERKQKWVDPSVGIRAALKLNCGFSIEGRGIIGGFDVSSKLFWDVYGALGYSWDYGCATLELLAGYRWLSVDYKKGDYIFDVRQFGPLLGLIVSF